MRGERRTQGRNRITRAQMRNVKVSERGFGFGPAGASDEMTYYWRGYCFRCRVIVEGSLKWLLGEDRWLPKGSDEFDTEKEALGWARSHEKWHAQQTSMHAAYRRRKR